MKALLPRNAQMRIGAIVETESRLEHEANQCAIAFFTGDVAGHPLEKKLPLLSKISVAASKEPRGRQQVQSI